MNLRRSLPIVALFVLLLGALATVASAFSDQNKYAWQGDEPVLYSDYDVAIALREDGTFHVREIQQITFNDSFRTAFAEIPQAFVSEIRNVALSSADEPYRLVVGEPDEPGSYSVSYEQDAIYVEWIYEETEPGEMRTFVLEYDVVGGLWVYEDGDILEWRAVPADRSGVPVLASTVTVTLPEAVAADEVQLDAFGPSFTAEVEGRQVVFEAEEELPDGLAFQIMVGFPHGLVQAEVQPWQRAEDSASLVYTIPSVAVELDVQPDGTVEVVERQTVSVAEGVLYEGRRLLPMAYLDGITGLSVFEGEQPMTFVSGTDSLCEYCVRTSEQPRSPTWIEVDSVQGTMTLNEEAAGATVIEWAVPPLVPGEESSFVLQYTAVGGIQVREEEQVLAWTPVSGFDVAVEEAQVLLTLPPGVSAADVQIEGGVLQQSTDDGVIVAHEGAVAPGEAWQMRVTLPPGATAAQAPVWQQEVEGALAEAEAIREQIRQAEIRRARLQLAFGIGSLALLVGSLLVVGLLWYLLGRDQALTVVPEYLAEPPSDLPPGIVAYLLDEKPTPKGVLASLFHLATLGLLRIQLREPFLLSRNWDEALEEGQAIETPAGDTVTVPGHMVQLFNALRPYLEREATPLDEIAEVLPEIVPGVYYEMGQEANEFFEQMPRQARRRWLVMGQWIVLSAIGFAAAAAFTYLPSLGWIVVAPAVALVVAGLALILVSRWMPRRSNAGVEEAARWRAFERYLRQLQSYGDEAAAQKILERYFAYAVALDVEDLLLEQAARMGNRLPDWTRPIVIYRSQPPVSSSDDGGPTPAGPLRSRPAKRGAAERAGEGRPETSREGDWAETRTLEGLSQTLTRRLEQANASLTRALNTAVGEAGETPFQLVLRGAKGASKITWEATTTSLEIMEDILDAASSGGGSSSYRGSSGSSFRSSSSSRWGSSRSSSLSGRSSSSRSSGGGGSRGFGR